MSEVWLLALVVLDVARDDLVEMTGPSSSRASERVATPQTTYPWMNIALVCTDHSWLHAQRECRHVRDEEARAELSLVEVHLAREVQAAAEPPEHRDAIPMVTEELHRMVAELEARVAVVVVQLPMAVEQRVVVARLAGEEHLMGEEGHRAEGEVREEAH